MGTNVLEAVGVRSLYPAGAKKGVGRRQEGILALEMVSAMWGFVDKEVELNF